MAAGSTTQRTGVAPDQGAREGGVSDSVLDRSGLRSNHQDPHLKAQKIRLHINPDCILVVAS
jgi:hypothetical protein